MKLHVDGIGILGPGFSDWPAAREILSGRAPYLPTEIALKASERLPAAERRRMTDPVKLALAICDQAMAQADPAATPSVFASSGGDGGTIAAILEILCSETREVSPTRFHNSVHNAPAGYWSIATGSRAASTSLGAHDHCFAAGLLEAAAQATSARTSVLLAVYDLVYPPVLDRVRPIMQHFGVSMLLSPQPGPGSLAAIAIDLIREDLAADTLADPALETLRQGNPAARALPLFAAIAGAGQRRIVLPYVAGNALQIEVTP